MDFYECEHQAALYYFAINPPLSLHVQLLPSVYTMYCTAPLSIPGG